MSLSCLCNKKINPSTTPVIWVIGAPGSGRGVFCQTITRHYGYTYVSTGSLLRTEAKSNSKYAGAASASLGGGRIAPSHVVIYVLQREILPLADASKGFVLDGFPREMEQSVEFQERIANPTVLLYFEVSASKIAKKGRFQTFLEKSEEVMALFPAKVRKINGDKSPADVLSSATFILDPIVESALEWRERQGD